MSKTKLVVTIEIVLILATSYWLYSNGKRNKEPKYKTEKVATGDVTATVTATGTLSAVTTVKVGSQVSGIISKLYADFNSQVTKGQLLAELDPTTLQAQVDQRRADLDRAVVEARNAKIAFDRAKNLVESNLLSESEYDAANATFRSSEAAVKQSQAALRQAETNLSYTKIVSPIDGVVVARDYDIGQTVAASFQAPTLFTIAQDLSKMQVSTSIDEADIGRIKIGQEADFSVDAFPDRPFKGIISQVRLASQVVQNVVTYPVLIDVSNPDLILKPGMTANVNIPVDERTNVLRVPNSALRLRPDPADLLKPSEPPDSAKDKKKSVVYTMTAEGKLKEIPVQTSITDGNYTAVETGELMAGMQVVTGLVTSKAMEATGGFAQQPVGSRRRP